MHGRETREQRFAGWLEVDLDLAAIRFARLALHEPSASQRVTSATTP